MAGSGGADGGEGAEEAGAADPAESADGTAGWPLVPGDTALTIKVPEADALVQEAFPAHVTVLFPFLPEERLDDGTTERKLAELVRAHDAFDLTFSEFACYPGVLYLDPWPHDPVTALAKDLTRCWPDVVPYWGIFGEGGLAPHLTLAKGEGPDTWRTAYDALAARLAPALPLHTRVRHVDLITWDGTRWCDRAAYPLG
ncbi:2'-5' RNA ligase family protein [Streptomyces sp. NPDC059009]|uniref:2'-5' RNA ligase family protein n=1 Tax=Streptomyces sp. NPDC059009 TaxID=3346694 RepID=UPI00367C4AC4